MNGWQNRQLCNPYLKKTIKPIHKGLIKFTSAQQALNKCVLCARLRMSEGGREEAVRSLTRNSQELQSNQRGEGLWQKLVPTFSFILGMRCCYLMWLEQRIRPKWAWFRHNCPLTSFLEWEGYCWANNSFHFITENGEKTEPIHSHMTSNETEQVTTLLRSRHWVCPVYSDAGEAAACWLLSA